MKLQANGISVTIKDKKILSDVSLSVVPGELVGLIGPNGAGKSTLLKVLAGLRKAEAGTVLLDGSDLCVLGASARARALAYMPQERNVYWPIKVQDLVALGRLPFGKPFAPLSSEDRAAINVAMTRTAIDRFADRIATTLSGGELARVLLARALAQTPKIILADEPIAGLDPAHQLRLLGLMRDVALSGMGVVVILHDLSLAARFCDRLVLLCEGEHYDSGLPQDVLTKSAIADVYGVEAAFSQRPNALSITAVGVIP